MPAAGSKEDRVSIGVPGSVVHHYASENLLQRIRAGLAAAGKQAPYSIDDLAAVDQFHIGGKPATEGLIALAQFAPGWRVLDVGGGIGGPARTIAAMAGCAVTLLDLTPEFCRTAAELCRLTGLADRVAVREGDALAMPFDAASFDAAWTQHSSMNIENKEALYREIRRVVRPGGTLAIHEVMAGSRGDLAFPVPWARHRDISHLRTTGQMRDIIECAGLTTRAWEDVSQAALYWWRARQPPAPKKAAPPQPPPPLGLHLLLGDEFPEMLQNMIRNLEDDKIRVIRAVFTRR
jgi:ubiquinone/menaquinone biosynthesis C-methylase UbiE